MNSLMLWLTRPWPCKWGKHERNDNNWGYLFGYVDFYCTRCEKRIETTPIEACTESVRLKVSAAQRRTL